MQGGEGMTAGWVRGRQFRTAGTMALRSAHRTVTSGARLAAGTSSGKRRTKGDQVLHAPTLPDWPGTAIWLWAFHSGHHVSPGPGDDIATLHAECG